MSEMMHLIKKYANGRLYDINQKKYITMNEIEGFIHADTAFKVVVSKTDEDITDAIIAKIKDESISRVGKSFGHSVEKTPRVIPRIKAGKIKDTVAKTRPKTHEDESKSIFEKVLRLGEETLAGYGQKYSEIWHSVMTLAEEEFEKRFKQLVKAKELSESEAGRVKQEITGFTRGIKNWLGHNVEDRIEEVLAGMNLATRDQVEKLAEKINKLNEKLEILERMQNEPKNCAANVVSEK